MKKIAFVLLVFICETVIGKDMIKISGRILNANADSINVSYVAAAIVYKPVDHKVKLDSEGRFDMAFEVPKGFTDIEIILGDQETKTYVQPGAELTVTLDAKNFDSTVHYEGKGKELANFCAKYELEHPMMQKVEVQGQMLCKGEPAEFETGLKQLEESELAFLQKYGTHLPTGFENYFKINCRYQVYAIMEKYPPYHEMMNKRSTNNIPKESYKVVNDIPAAFNDSYLDVPAYRAFLPNYYFTRIASELVSLDLTLKASPTADSTYTRAYKEMPPKTAEYFIGQQMLLNIKYRPLDKLEEDYAVYKKRFPYSKNLDMLADGVAAKKKFGDGKPAIDFDITTPEGKHMKLSDLKGNVVLIDFWASWCAPCRGEMPAAKKVRAYFKDKPVSFVYVSIDENEEAWKKAINDLEVEGINTCVGKGWQSETAKKYNIVSVPSHFMVDKQGNFVNTDDLASVSETEKLIGQIEHLLK